MSRFQVDAFSSLARARPARVQLRRVLEASEALRDALEAFSEAIDVEGGMREREGVSAMRIEALSVEVEGDYEDAVIHLKVDQVIEAVSSMVEVVEGKAESLLRDVERGFVTEYASNNKPRSRRNSR